VSEKIIRYRPGIDPVPEDRTDWERLRRMTDEEIEANALSDPDSLPMTDAEIAQTRRSSEVLTVRMRLGLSQAAFAKRFHINLRTLQDWEQGRRAPEELARAYLRVIGRNPDLVAAALED
jgi:putative transcriptional regulator